VDPGTSVVQGPARPKSWGLGSAYQGSGLLRLQAGPSSTAQARLSKAQAQAGALYSFVLEYV
jgi:hypothetical protein